jgi:hypothetical protein
VAPTRELTEPVDVAGPDGRLAPEAVGWARTPVHRWNGRGPWGRRKRWECWCVAGDGAILAVTVADVDVAGVAVATVVDLATGELVEKLALRAFGLRPPLPDAPHGGDVRFDAMGLRIDLLPSPGATRVVVASRAIDADVVVDRPPGHDTLNVLVPRSDVQYRLTSKQFALRARGTVRARGRRHVVDGAFAGLDFGHGVWPYRTEWNWGCAAGVQDGRTVGINLGARWTDGTPVTETA